MKLAKGLRDPRKLKSGDIVVFGGRLEETVQSVKNYVTFVPKHGTKFRYKMPFDSILWKTAKLK
jgi:ASC-1-like (ASCH) protein